jgi:UDP:flavonoid glycosyltransferase YjiC (YdhE family)
VQTAAASGTPVVEIALQPEQQMNLDHMEEYGAALRIPCKKWRSAAIRNAVCLILHNDSYKENAQALMKKIIGMDGGKEAAAIIWEKINDLL